MVVKGQGGHEGRRGVLWLGKSNRERCSDGIVLYLGCINVNILVVILSSRFAKYYLWGENWVKDTGTLLFLFLITAYESTIVSK